MASSRSRRPNQQVPSPDKAAEILRDQQSNDAELLRQGAEMGPDAAQSLQSSVGNASLNDMLTSAGRMDGPDLEEEQEQDQDQDQEQEVDQDQDLDGLDTAFSDLMGAMGARETLVASADVQDWQRLFGGDPDEEPPPQRRVHRIPDALKPPVQPARNPDEATERGGGARPLALPPLGEVRAPERDERFDALWAWLRDPYQSVGADFEPESLVDDEGALARVASLARFIQGAFREPLARGMASLGRPLPGGPGMAGQVARAAALVELGALSEPVDIRVANRACAAALETDAPVHARAAARICMQERRLRADLVTDVALYGEVDDEPDLDPLPALDERAQMLVASGLQAAVRPAPIPDPGRHAQRPSGDSTADASTAELDRLLMELTGGLPPSDTIDYEVLGPVLQGADNQLLFAGRTQVEVAAAGIALRRVAGLHARAGVRHLLFAVDRELRDIAKSTAMSAQRAEVLVGRTMTEGQVPLHAVERELEALAARLRRVREAALDALATRHAARQAPVSTPETTSPPTAAPHTSEADTLAYLSVELIGPGLEQAADAERRLSPLQGRALIQGRIRQGERLRRLGDARACRVLAEAARLALLQNQPDLDWQARAGTVRALAQLGRTADAQALLPRLERDGEGILLELARAELGGEGSLQNLAQHLAQPIPAGQAHDWLEGHVLVAEGYSREARWEQADRHWASAQAIARQHGASTAELSLLRAATLTVCGRPAKVHLESALASDETQVQLAASLLLAGEHLAAGRSEHALAAAERAWGLAMFRRNWHGFSCAAIDRAAALDQMGQDGTAVLHQALATCRMQGEPGALLQARLMELQ